MKEITWKKVKGLPNHLEGFVDGELAFNISGTLCVSDLRAMKASYETNTHVSPKHYKIKDKDDGKSIAYDLLNGLNLEKHEANWHKWEEESAKSAQFIQDSKKFLEQLRNKKEPKKVESLERFLELQESTKSSWDGDNTYQGAQIIAKYTTNIFQAAGHDIIYSEDVDVLIEAGITEEDAKDLFKLNWGIDKEYGCLYCFV